MFFFFIEYYSHKIWNLQHSMIALIDHWIETNFKSKSNTHLFRTRIAVMLIQTPREIFTHMLSSCHAATQWMYQNIYGKNRYKLTAYKIWFKKKIENIISYWLQITTLNHILWNSINFQQNLIFNSKKGFINWWTRILILISNKTRYWICIFFEK